MRLVDGLSVREIINQRFLTCATKKMAIPMTKTENTALKADWGKQSEESIWNYRVLKIDPNFKSMYLLLLTQDMITQKATSPTVQLRLR